MQIRKDIQTIRGLAVLIVVFFHLQVPNFQNGFLGVDVFFVVSGFLMAMLYDQGTKLDFYKRRLNRLLPAYAATLLFTLAAGVFRLIPVDFQQLADQAMAGSLFVSNIFYWNQNSYFDKSAFNPLLNLWSLAVEVQFYLLVPFLFPVLRRHRWAFSIVFLASLLACFAVQLVSPKTSFFQLPFRIWEFLIGAGVAWWANHASSTAATHWRKALQLALLLALVSYPFLIELKPDRTGTLLYGHPAVPALVVTTLTGLIISVGLPPPLLANALGRTLAKIGDYSYSIYLVHFPIIVLWNYEPFGGTRLSISGFAASSWITLSIAVAAMLSHNLLERRFSARLATPVWRGAAIVGIVGAAFILSSVNTSRFNETEQRVFGAWADRDTYRCGKVFRIVNPTAQICRIRETGGRKVAMLVGDSHADAIKTAFADRAVLAGYSTDFPVANDSLIGAGPNARQLVDQATERGVSLIVLHYNNVYQSSKNIENFKLLLKLALKNAIRIAIIGPVPSFDAHIPKALFVNQVLPNGVGLNRAQHVARTQHYRALAREVEATGVRTFDPAGTLCPAERTCLYAAPDSTPYYHDSNHLTLTGAVLLNPLFDELFKSD